MQVCMPKSKGRSVNYEMKNSTRSRLEFYYAKSQKELKKRFENLNKSGEGENTNN